MTASEIVRTRLLAIPAVTALVGSRVYNLVLPANLDDFPAIRVQRISDLEIGHLRGTGALHTARVQVDAYATSLASALDVDSAAAGIGDGSGLLGFTGVVDGVVVRAVLAGGLVRDEFESGELDQYRVMRDVFVTWTDRPEVTTREGNANGSDRYVLPRRRRHPRVRRATHGRKRRVT